MALPVGAAVLAVVGLGLIALAEHGQKKPTAPAKSPSLPTPQPLPTPAPIPAPSPQAQPANPFLVGPGGSVIFQNDPNVGNPNLPATGVEAAVPENPGAFTPDDMAAMSGGSGMSENDGQGSQWANSPQGTSGFAMPFGFNPFVRSA